MGFTCQISHSGLGHLKRIGKGDKLVDDLLGHIRAQTSEVWARNFSARMTAIGRR